MYVNVGRPVKLDFLFNTPEFTSRVVWNTFSLSTLWIYRVVDAYDEMLWNHYRPIMINIRYLNTRYVNVLSLCDSRKRSLYLVSRRALVPIDITHALSSEICFPHSRQGARRTGMAICAGARVAIVSATRVNEWAGRTSLRLTCLARIWNRPLIGVNKYGRRRRRVSIARDTSTEGDRQTGSRCGTVPKHCQISRHFF